MSEGKGLGSNRYSFLKNSQIRRLYLEQRRQKGEQGKEKMNLQYLSRTKENQSFLIIYWGKRVKE